MLPLNYQEVIDRLEKGRKRGNNRWENGATSVSVTMLRKTDLKIKPLSSMNNVSLPMQKANGDSPHWTQ